MVVARGEGGGRAKWEKVIERDKLRDLSSPGDVTYSVVTTANDAALKI